MRTSLVFPIFISCRWLACTRESRSSSVKVNIISVVLEKQSNKSLLCNPQSFIDLSLCCGNTSYYALVAASWCNRCIFNFIFFIFNTIWAAYAYKIQITIFKIQKNMQFKQRFETIFLSMVLKHKRCPRCWNQNRANAFVDLLFL